MSTSDTEIFVLTGMLQRMLKLFPFLLGKSSSLLDTVNGARVFMGVVSVVAILFALLFTDLVGIYTWLLSAIVVISPIVLFSLFWKASPVAMFVSLLANTVVFVILVSTGFLNLDNIYLICIPGFIFYLIALMFSKNRIAHEKE